MAITPEFFIEEFPIHFLLLFGVDLSLDLNNFSRMYEIRDRISGAAISVHDRGGGQNARDEGAVV